MPRREQDVTVAPMDCLPGIMSLSEATEYLDWLESQGIVGREIVVLADGQCVVR
jgi:hypothetical protein